jgi:hypothetical protein
VPPPFLAIFPPYANLLFILLRKSSGKVSVPGGGGGGTAILWPAPQPFAASLVVAGSLVRCGRKASVERFEVVELRECCGRMSELTLRCCPAYYCFYHCSCCS